MTRVRARGEIAWGGIDQILSSATNLGLSILAGRHLGASGVGLIFLGFSAFLLALSLVRGFITAPFVIATSALTRAERENATRRCIALVGCSAIAATVLMVGFGFVIPGSLGRSLLLFAPWVGVALIQDQWRSVLFRDGRGAAAAFNDGAWGVGMLLMLPVVWAHPSDWSVAAMWGVGATVGALIGWLQVGLGPSGISEAGVWWNRELRRLGSWLAAESILVAAGVQVTVIILAVILSTSDLGGIRVIQVVFAPMTLVAEAFTFPGLPIMSRALASSMADARRWAWRLGLAALAVVGVYLALVTPIRNEILSRVFGPEFVQYDNLIPATILAQLPMAAATGFLILLKADRRGHAIVGGMAIRTALTLTLTPLLAVQFGALGAVWGITVAAFVGSAVTIYFGLLPHDISFRLRRRALVSSDAPLASGGDNR